MCPEGDNAGLPELGHIKLVQVCSRFVFEETFEPRFNLVRCTTKQTRKCEMYPKLVVGDFQ